jgi:hypothetical protein
VSLPRVIEIKHKVTQIYIDSHIQGIQIDRNKLYELDKDWKENRSISKELILSNENIKKVVVHSRKPFECWVSANISFAPQKRDVFASAEANQYVNIYLSYSLTNIQFNSEPVELNMKFVGEFADVYNDKIQDEDLLRERIHDVLFRVLEPSLKIEDIEIYFNPEYWIDKVEGMEVDANGTSSRDGFSYDMFKKIS